MLLLARVCISWLNNIYPPVGAAGDEEDDEAHKAAMAEMELERAALELHDTSEQSGFSISVNSVDRFGRQSQVRVYWEYFLGEIETLSSLNLATFAIYASTMPVNR